MDRAEIFEAASTARGDCVDEGDRAQHLAALRVADALAARYEPPADPQTIDRYTGAVVCCDCLIPIPLDRLKAIPGAVRCVECQREAERYYGAGR